jgi:PAS domain S-box-containing protein
MPQIVWITRADGWNIYFNQQWVDYTGLTLEESYGHGWNTPFHPDDRQRAWDAWKNATENDATYSLDCRLRRADGTYRWWLVRGVPLRDADGKILKWFGTCTDIDHIKQDAALIANQLEELLRWQNVMLGREDRVRELKREVNGLCRRTGEAARYPSQEDAAANPLNAHEEEHKR